MAPPPPRSSDKLRVGHFRIAPCKSLPAASPEAFSFGWIEAFKKVTPCILLFYFTPFSEKSKDIYRHELCRFY